LIPALAEALTPVLKRSFNEKYQTTMKTRGFGFEDWHFNCVTLADGIEHRPVPGTGYSRLHPQLSLEKTR